MAFPCEFKDLMTDDIKKSLLGYSVEKPDCLGIRVALLTDSGNKIDCDDKDLSLEQVEKMSLAKDVNGNLTLVLIQTTLP